MEYFHLFWKISLYDSQVCIVSCMEAESLYTRVYLHPVESIDQ